MSTSNKHPGTKAENPLDRFQSYSVHYVLVAARTTKSLEPILGQNSKSKDVLSAINAVESLGSPIKFPGIGAEEMYLVIDTRRFSQFTVDNLKYEVLVNGIQSGGTHANLATDLSMTVTDSVGISFANYLQWLLDTRVRTSYDGLVWLLQVMFVGHNADGSTETVLTEMIPMILQQINVDLNFAKGVYEMLFMPNMNFNTQKHSKFLRIPLGAGAAIAKEGRLGQLVKSFQDRMNTESEKFYSKLQANIPKREGGVETKKNFGRKVQYFITIPPKWNEYEVSSVQETKAPETQFSKDGATGSTASGSSTTGVVHATEGASQTITQALDAMFARTAKVGDMANFKKVEEGVGVIQFYKYIVGISSEPEVFTIHVSVVEFSVPQLRPPEEANTPKVGMENSEWYEVVEREGVRYSYPKKFYSYDYIFTGRNDQILNFDLKMQDYQFMLASNLNIGPAAVNQTTDGGSGQPPEVLGQLRDLLNMREYDPVLPPIKTGHEEQAFSMFSKTKPRDEVQKAAEQFQQYTRNLSMFYAGSPIIANLTIKGNPTIMQQFNIPNVMKAPEPKDQSDAGRKSYHEDLMNRVLQVTDGRATSDGVVQIDKVKTVPAYAVTPAFVHINVMGPNVDFATNKPIEGSYATSVLSDNYYVIFKLVNKIEGSVFTQDMELYAHNIFGAYKMDKSGNVQAQGTQ